MNGRCVWGMPKALHWVCHLLLTGAEFAWCLGESRRQDCSYTVQALGSHLNQISVEVQDRFLLQWVGTMKLAAFGDKQ